MKSFQYAWFIFVLTLCFFPATSVYSSNTLLTSPSEQQAQLTVLEDLSAELRNNGRTVDIKGAVKNISRSILKGYITIYLLDSDGGVLNAKDETIATGIEFSQGVVIDFEVSIKVPKKKKIASISVDFTKE